MWHENAFAKLGSDVSYKISNTYGTYQKVKNFSLFRIKPKTHNYADFNNTSAQLAKGLHQMASNEYEATEAIQFAIREFEKIIALHKPDKKELGLMIKSQESPIIWRVLNLFLLFIIVILVVNLNLWAM